MLDRDALNAMLASIGAVDIVFVMYDMPLSFRENAPCMIESDMVDCETALRLPMMFGVSTSRRNPVFSAQELGAQHRAIFVPDMDRSLEGIAKSVMIPALAAQNKTYELHRSMTAFRDSKKSLRWYAL